MTLERRRIASAFPEARIMVVEDDAASVMLLESLLKRSGYRNLRFTRDPRQSLDLCREFRPDLLLLDLHMAHLDGFGVMEALPASLPPGELPTVLVLTADATSATKHRALASGAKDFLSKPLDTTEVLLRINNLLETRSLNQALHRQNEILEERVVDRTRALDEAQLEILDRLSQAAEFRDDDTGQHTRRVGEMSARLARALAVGDEEVELIRRAAPLHDVGKIAIPDTILLKPGRLTAEEMAVMRTHTTVGAQILANGRSEMLRMAEVVALTHHERWDGSGYPRGLAGSEIPLQGRIVAVADFHDALGHDRPYRKAWPRDTIRAEMISQSGRHFDPAVVAAFLALDS